MYTALDPECHPPNALRKHPAHAQHLIVDHHTGRGGVMVNTAIRDGSQGSTSSVETARCCRRPGTKDPSGPKGISISPTTPACAAPSVVADPTVSWPPVPGPSPRSAADKDTPVEESSRSTVLVSSSMPPESSTASAFSTTIGAAAEPSEAEETPDLAKLLESRRRKSERKRAWATRSPSSSDSSESEYWARCPCWSRRNHHPPRHQPDPRLKQC